MITWMQKHKSWLVVTIWVSTIAFVGAGFVGWGSYDFSKSGGTIAKVGDIEIKSKDVNNQYSMLYNQYKQAFGEEFNDEFAKKINLENIAIQRSISNALLLNWAEDIGMSVSVDELGGEIIKYDAFKKDGKFDKDTYVKALQANRSTPKEFEENLKKDIIVQKVQKIFTDFAKNNPNEIDDISLLFAIQDDVDIKVISADDIIVDKDSKELKAYWEKKKEFYKSPIKFNFDISYQDINDDAKKAKTDALKKYLNLKKNKIKFESKISVSLDELKLFDEDKEKLNTAKVGDILKPIRQGDRYLILKLTSKIPSAALPFSEVVDIVAKSYQSDVLLEKKAKDELKNFKGVNIGLIDAESNKTIDGLTAEESHEFISKLFTQNEPKGQISLQDKRVLYKINKTEFKKESNDKKQIVSSKINTIKTNILIENLVTKLTKIYEIEKYYKL
ncbi:MAG: hypothetical protein B1H07_04450 [Campylobacteraceae bacterium 4484_166]|nr:MAG: hypothetical protein B1H07_04450 [Campylobacteraceae bacterium 4484_166]